MFFFLASMLEMAKINQIELNFYVMHLGLKTETAAAFRAISGRS